jgi:hypothetical protein
MAPIDSQPPPECAPEEHQVDEKVFDPRNGNHDSKDQQQFAQPDVPDRQQGGIGGVHHRQSKNAYAPDRSCLGTWGGPFACPGDRLGILGSW